jgi:plasmid stabilization system protein ParE
VKYNLIYMELALRDIAEIKAYLSGFYSGTWPRFAKKLEQNVADLSDTPFIGETYQPHPAYRHLIVDDYQVFYKVIESAQTVQVHRVLHGSRDIQRYLEFDEKHS